jgi:hypothetical protein
MTDITPTPLTPVQVQEAQERDINEKEVPEEELADPAVLVSTEEGGEPQPTGTNEMLDEDDPNYFSPEARTLLSNEHTNPSY